MRTSSGLKPLPIGYEFFDQIRINGFYYVDKTALISDLLDGVAQVNLFTRPRRFGKSLNMSMLKCFFEYGHDKSIFREQIMKMFKDEAKKDGELLNSFCKALKTGDAENGSFEPVLQGALKQIEDKGYAEELIADDYPTVYKYGIACYRKKCRVVVG